MAKTTSRFLRELVTTLCVLLLAIPYTILLPVVIIVVFVPFKLYRRFVESIARKLDPDLGRMITGLNASQTRDYDVYTKKPYSGQVVCLSFKGPLLYEQVRDAFLNRIVLKRDESKPYPPGSLFYPELQQYITSFMGYAFLKRDRKFDILNHSTFLNKNSNQPVGKPEVMSIWESLMTKPFEKNRSPWEFIMLDNYQPDQEELEHWTKLEGKSDGKSDHYWIAFLRMHHSLADGFSIQKMISYLSDEPYVPEFSIREPSLLQKFLLNLRTVVLGPYDTMNRLIRYSDSYHALHRPNCEHSREYFVVESKFISMKTQVNSIKKSFQASATSVLITAISGGIRRFLVSNGKPLPDYISTAVPFATPAHTEKLINDFLLAPIGLGIHSEDAKERMEYVKKQMNLLTSTSWIRMLDLYVDLLGSMPISWFRFLTKKSLFSATYSTQPGPKKFLKGFGSTLLNVGFSFGTGSDSISFGLSSITYKENFRIVLFIDKNVIGSRDKAEELISYIGNEFDVLEGYSNNTAKNLVNELSWEESVKND